MRRIDSEIIKLIRTYKIEEALKRFYPYEEIKAFHKNQGLIADIEEFESAMIKATVGYVRNGPYRMQKEVMDIKAEDKKKLEAIQNCARDLLERIKEFEDVVIGQLGSEGARVGIPLTEGASTDYRDRIIEGGHIYTEQLMSLLEALPTAIGAELSYQHHIPKGRPEEYGLKKFVFLMISYWEHHEGKSFTIDYHKGAPLTEGLRFLCGCIALIDDVPDSAVITAAREMSATNVLHMNDAYL